MNIPQPGVLSAMYDIPKYALLAFITSVPFDFIQVPQQYATDRQEDYFAFLDAITQGLNKVLREKAPTKTSPKKALSSWTIREDPLTPTPTYATPPFSNIAKTSSQDCGVVKGELENPNIVHSSNTPTTTTPNPLSWNVSEEHDEDSLVTSIRGLSNQRTLSPTERRIILREKTLAAEERARRPFVTREDPRPDITGYEPKSISSERKRQMRPYMEELKKTIEWDPFMTVDLGKFPNLGLPRIYISGRVEPYEDDLGRQPFGLNELYDFNCWALMDTAADASVICSEYLGVELARDQRCLAYFSVRFVGIPGLEVESSARIVSRNCLPNHGEGVDVILRQRLLLECLTLRIEPTVHSHPLDEMLYGHIDVEKYFDPVVEMVTWKAEDEIKCPHKLQN